MDLRLQHSTPEIWGGIECTINRLASGYRDQLEYSGYYEKPDALAQICQLGIKRFRFPILWERHHPTELKQEQWRITRERLALLEKYNVEPIAGLLHHGSGPADTELLDPEFPDKFARYALEVATQFPAIRYYTPINEPLTTARFSGLYGFWYPHRSEEGAFLRMFLNQLKATVMAMRAIRTVNKEAVLIQTEDLGKTHSTPLLGYQAAFENQRRWWTFDFLMGRVIKGHPVWEYFVWAGIDESTLQYFADNPCVPETIGFNYYITSERYLDEKWELYAPFTHGSNSRHRYADTEAARTGHLEGAKALLKEAWLRYHTPLALTECFMSCTREQQMRWFNEQWQTVSDLRTQGIDVTAITAWALLGSTDWNSLVCVNNGHFDQGAFNMIGDELQPNALAGMIKQLCGKGKSTHPILNGRGWWEGNGTAAFDDALYPGLLSPSPILLINGDSAIGDTFLRLCAERVLHVEVMLAHSGPVYLDSLKQALDDFSPWAVINAGAEIVNEEGAGTDTNAGLRTQVVSMCAAWRCQFVNVIIPRNDEPGLPHHEVHLVLDQLIDRHAALWP